MHSTPKPQISSKKRKKNLDDKIADSLDEAKKLLQSLNKEEDDDADSAFAYYIKIRFQEIKDNNLKEKARIEIQQILYKYSIEESNK